MKNAKIKKPTRSQAEEAVRTLIRWAGDDPAREGLRDTPARVTRAYEEYFAGYAKNPASALSRTFKEVEGYDEMIVLRDIQFNSHCEHHMAPFSGRVHIAYIPRSKVLGISKLARLVEIYARRLQIQEKLTAQIATALNDTLKPHGVAVVVEAVHSCMTTRGVMKPGTALLTSHLLGSFRSDPRTRQEFFSLLKVPQG